MKIWGLVEENFADIHFIVFLPQGTQNQTSRCLSWKGSKTL